jgi:hypothetical protein
MKRKTLEKKFEEFRRKDDTEALAEVLVLHLQEAQGPEHGFQRASSIVKAARSSSGGLKGLAGRPEGLGMATLFPRGPLLCECPKVASTKSVPLRWKNRGHPNSRKMGL